MSEDDSRTAIQADDVLSRRTCLAAGLFVLTGLAGNLSEAHAQELPGEELDIIDCHTHFYDPGRPEGVPWPPRDSSLYRTVLPAHLKELKQYRPVTGTVIVEASPWVEDNAWLLDLAKDDPFIVGIVGNLNPGSDGFANHMKRFAANELYRGIRINVQLLKQLLDKNTLGDLSLLADHDLALDVNGGPETPAVIAECAKRLPQLRMVQNHLANVPVTASAPPRDWQEGMRLAARQPNVYCKISALLESAWHHAGGKAPEELDFYRPYIDTVWQAFGDDRVIYGSNWPVSERASDYQTLQRIYLEYALEHGLEVTRKFCSLNAKHAYNWIERPGRRTP